MHFQSVYDKLKEEVKKLNLETLKNVDDIFEQKGINLKIDFCSDDPNYLELRKAKIKAQLYINNFGNYQNFHNCQQFMGDQSAGNDNDKHVYASPPNKDEVFDALSNYAMWFLKTQHAENRSLWNNIPESVKSGVVMCSICDTELALHESACLVCEEPVTTIIEDLIREHNSEGVRESRSNRRQEDHCDRDRDCFNSEPEKKEIEQRKCMGDGVTMSDFGVKSQWNSTNYSGTRDSHTQLTEVISYPQNKSANSKSSSWPGNSWGAVECGVNWDANSAETEDPVTQASRDSQDRSGGVAELLDRPTASDSHNGRGMSTLPELGDRAGAQMDSTNGWRCGSCGMQNDESFLSCQACSIARVTTWTCVYCTIDYKLSIRKCEVCDREWEGVVKRIFCAWCRENEVLGNEICEECIGTQWLCWRSRCQGINYGKGQYCAYCGIDKDGDRSPGQPIRVLKDGRIDIKWICSLCGVMNDNYAARCRCGQCRGPRYPIEKSHSAAAGDPIGRPEKQVPINNGQPEPPLSVSAFEQTDLWKCKTCVVSNEPSRKQCIACGRSRYCHGCGCEENTDEGLCAACLTQKWRCWYSHCRSINFSTDNQYCEKCGLARETPRVSGEAIWWNIRGRSGLVWVCDYCGKINDNSRRLCSGSGCCEYRNKDFVWCSHCGYGNPPNKWTDTFLKICKACDNYV